ncbi:MAG: prolipoprotein diacylglyceryl transferase, partial [Clostridia bacterium]|nr:prolipoprotein diacylglyceryl transferase [Clostridia bacterium]
EKKPITKIFDFGAVMLPLGQAIGRWGTYFNQEVYGAVDPRSIGFPVSVYIQDAGEYHYALFFWESVANIVLFALLYWFLFKYKGKRNGYATSFYFMGYGVIRAVMEPLRDAQYNLPLFGSETLGSEWASILLILGGLALFVVLFVRDFRDNGKNFKKYFAYMFGERRASEKAENIVRHEARTDDGEKTSLSVRSVKNLKPSHRSESTVETRETADGEENEEEEAILTALDDDGDL